MKTSTDTFTPLARFVGGMLLYTLLFTAKSSAQNEIIPNKHFDRYSGLSAKTLYTICNDPDGFIWLGSDNGVFCFDGKTFYHYSTADGLCDNEILAMYSDSRGRIWCSGYNGKISKIENGVIDTQSPYIRNWPNHGLIVDFAEDSLGNIYLVSENRHLYRIGPSGEFWSRPLPVKMASVWRMILHDHRLFLQAHGGTAFVLNPGMDSLLPFHFTPLRGMRAVRIFASRESNAMWETNPFTGIHKDLLGGQTIYLPWNEDENLRFVSQPVSRWVLFSIHPNKVMLYDLASNTSRRIRLPQNALVPETAWDAQDNLWMITPHDGLFAFHSGYGAAEQKPLPGFADNIVGACVYENRLFAATSTGDWIVDDGTRRDTTTVLGDVTLSEPIETTDFVATTDFLYATYGPLGRILYKSGKFWREWKGNKSALFYKDSTWVIRNHDHIFVLDGTREHTVFKERTYHICIQGDILWFSSFWGLHRYDLLTDSLYGITFQLPNDGRIERTTPLGDHMQIICTNTGGVWLLWEGRTLLGKLTMENGLQDNDCKELDAYGQGWIVRHPLGLSKIERNGLRIQTVSEWGGLPMSTINGIYVDGDYILLSSSRGLFRVEIATLFGETKEDREVKFMQIHSKGKSLQPTDIQLQPGGNHLRIDFAIPEYDHPERVQYQWRINGEAWTKTFNNSLEFADLNSGDYVFEVKARVPGHDWTGVSNLRFRVITPFWSTWWFMLAAGLLAVGTVWLYFRRSYRKKLATEREKASVRYQLMDFEQKALNAMMNPHFVFNAMGSIQHLLHSGNNQQANDYLVKFSRLIRKSLETSQLEFCYLDDEIERLTLYLQLEKMRFDGRMNFEIDVDDNLDAEQVKIPTMILQTYVENAIIHGAAAVRHHAHVYIRFWEHGGVLCAYIQDNGPGFDVGNKAKRSARFGVSATEKRLQLLTQITGKPYSVNIVSPLNPEGGTRVELLFSIKE